MTVSTGLKGSQFDRFGGSHSAQKFGLAHTTRHARGARETPDTGHSKFRCLDINANRHPPAPSARKAIVKREEIPRTEAAAALPIAGLPRRGSSRSSAVSSSTRCRVLLRFRGEHEILAPSGFSSQMPGRSKENFPNPNSGGLHPLPRLRASFRCYREFASHFHLDILPERRYFHLECLPKNNENASNYCREPWTC